MGFSTKVVDYFPVFQSGRTWIQCLKKPHHTQKRNRLGNSARGDLRLLLIDIETDIISHHVHPSSEQIDGAADSSVQADRQEQIQRAYRVVSRVSARLGLALF
ncbi:hypothetical protein TNCV_3312151 [Trichonephila clavipes]|nr:hypothetical protein TNCV_3312151 [Trichonephila clavipes]